MINEDVFQWYKENGLNPWDFRCPHLEDCKEGVDDFTTARPPTIGKRYADGSIPRLLVISSDAGSGDPLSEDEQFKLAGRKSNVDELPEKRHWSETLKIVLAIQREFDASLSLEDSRMCFAHERAVMCCENRTGSKEARRKMFRNCRDYIPRQLPVYRPQIILTQGNRAKWAVAGGDYHVPEEWTSCGQEGHDCRYRVISLGENLNPLWIHTYHPSPRARRYYRPARDGYFSCYPKLIAKHFSDWTPDS